VSNFLNIFYDLSEFEIELHFTLSAEKLEEVFKRRGQSNRLGLAVQMGSVPAGAE